MALADWRTLTQDKLRDTAGKVTQDQLDRAIAQAVARYSRLRPLAKIATLTGDGHAVVFALPSDYVPGFSRALSIEYPVGKQEPQYLDDTQDYQVDDTDRDPSTSALRVRLLTVTLPAGAHAYLAYTVPHTVSSSVDTIPVLDRGAACAYAASLGCRELASYYAQTSDPTITAAAVVYRDRPAVYQAQAKDLEREFNEHLGVPSDGIYAASVTRDQDVDLGPGIGDRFYHARVFR
jgi:hypothetical protein